MRGGTTVISRLFPFPLFTQGTESNEHTTKRRKKAKKKTSHYTIQKRAIAILLSQKTQCYHHYHFRYKAASKGNIDNWNRERGFCYELISEGNFFTAHIERKWEYLFAGLFSVLTAKSSPRGRQAPPKKCFVGYRIRETFQTMKKQISSFSYSWTTDMIWKRRIWYSTFHFFNTTCYELQFEPTPRKIELK